MLDISIQSASKYLTNNAKKAEFLTIPLIIEAKYDGVKVTIVKIANTGRAEEDYLVSYKNNLIFPDEFDFVSKTHIKTKSIGSSQFQFVWDHLKKLRKNKIPIGTELFVEYLMKKPTLSSKYTKLHGMILIGHSKSSYEIRGAKLFTSPQGFFTNKREDYANEMKLGIPEVLFDGVLTPKTSFLKGIKNETLKNLYRERADDINWDDQDSIILGISQMLLDVPSQFGGKEEGIVIKYKNKNTIIKFQQEYQVDQEARRKIKAKYKGTAEEEKQYWDNVYKVVDDIMKKIDIFDLQKALKDVAKYLKTYKPTFGHPVKNNDMIKEDIQLSAKMMISKKLPGSNGALIVGKFRVFSIAHYNMIKEAQAKYSTVTIAIVSSKETKGTKKLRNKILEDCLSSFGNIEIINTSSGNLVSIINKATNNINSVIAGTDRVENYEQQLQKMKGIGIYEVKRTDTDISASKIIKNLEDFEYFKKNTPKCSWKYYNEYLEVYKG
jgi:hypothetical protein